MEDCLPSEGGGYSYYLTMLAAINRHSFHQDVEIINLNFYKEVPGQLQLSKEVIYVKKTFFGALCYQVLNVLYKLLHRVLSVRVKLWLEAISRLKHSINNNAARRILKRENIHLVYYLNPEENLINYPMIVTHWDIGHRSMYPFPEVAWNGNFEKRENYYRKILNKAFLILCESETGAKELQHYYPLNPAKIKVLPIFSGDVVSQQVSEKEQQQILSAFKLLKNEFYIYPAQFWAHKNHSTLIQAFSSLLKEPGNESLKLVLCGSDKGNLAYVKELINTLSLDNSVILPGFVSNEFLYTLYKNAIALVMPTFLGPTNIPVIEAAELECAVVCSNLEGHKEILGNNALYFEPSCMSAIQYCMQRVLDDEMRKQLIASAYIHIRNSRFRVERSIPLLDRFLQQLKPVRSAWGINLKLLIAFAKIGFLSFN